MIPRLTSVDFYNYPVSLNRGRSKEMDSMYILPTFLGMKEANH